MKGRIFSIVCLCLCSNCRTHRAFFWPPADSWNSNEQNLALFFFCCQIRGYTHVVSSTTPSCPSIYHRLLSRRVSLSHSFFTVHPRMYLDFSKMSVSLNNWDWGWLSWRCLWTLTEFEFKFDKNLTIKKKQRQKRSSSESWLALYADDIHKYSLTTQESAVCSTHFLNYYKSLENFLFVRRPISLIVHGSIQG